MTSKLFVNSLEPMQGNTISVAGSDTVLHAPGHVIQTVQGFSNTQANTNNSTDTEALTALRTSITPKSSTSKLLVMVSYHIVTVSNSSMATAHLKRSTNGGSSFSNLSDYLQGTGNETHRNALSTGYFGQHSQIILDSPSTTSTCIYSLFMRTNGSNIRLNDNGAGTRIVIQEIAQ